MELEKIKEFWEQFSEIPVDNNDLTEQEFLDFPVGTEKFKVWHWFDEQCPNGLVKDLIFCQYE